MGIFLSTPQYPQAQRGISTFRIEVAGIELMKSVRTKQLKMLQDKNKTYN
jgi:hypothetical protein